MTRGGRWRLYGFVALFLLFPAPARAGFFSVILVGGAAGSSSILELGNFNYSHGNGQVGLNSLLSDGTHKGSTGGGNVFFTPMGLPILLNLSDGYGYLSSPGAPSELPPGVVSGSPSPVAPVAGGSLPSDAALLGITNTAGESADGSRIIKAFLTDPESNPLGEAKITIPQGGWWVLGISPLRSTDPDPGPEPGGDPFPDDEEEPDTGNDPGTPPDVDPYPPPNYDPDPIPQPGPNVPEPSTLLMAAVGAGAWRFCWRKKPMRDRTPA